MQASSAQKLNNAMRRRRRRMTLATLGCLVVLVTGFALMVPAISMTKDVANNDPAITVSVQSSEDEEAADAEAQAGADGESSDADDEHAAEAAHSKSSEAAAPESKNEGESHSGSKADSKSGSNNGGKTHAADGSGESPKSGRASAGADSAKSTESAAKGGSSGESSSKTADDGKSGNQETPSSDEPTDVSAQQNNSASATGAEAYSPERPAQSFEQSLTDKKGKATITVSVEAPEGALPEGAKMRIDKVSSDDVQDAVEQAIADAAARAEVGKAEGPADKLAASVADARITAVQAVDITFKDADGAQIEPAEPLTVTFTAPKLATNAEAAAGGEANDPLIVHVDDEGEGDVVDVLTAKQLKKRDLEQADDQVVFDAEDFSVYVIVYTVDFSYSVNGETYEFSLPGGEKIALSNLIKVLGILNDTYSGEKPAFDNAADFLKEVAKVEFTDQSLVKVIQHEDDDDWTLDSLQPFNTDEVLTITMKNGNVITVKVTDDQIKKTVMSATGKTYEITVAYGEDAEIPESAELEVSEVTKGSSVYGRGYDEYIADTENALGIKAGDADYIRLFDIKIVDKSGNKIQPAEGSTVDVRIELADKVASNESEASTQVVHFADGSQDVDIVNAQVDGQTVSFEADGFSVYSIVDAPEPAIEDGALVSSLAELAQRYSYESGFYLSYGNIQYFTNTLKNGGCFVETSNKAEASQWYFEAVEGSEDTYVIYTLVNEEKQYMRNTKDNEMGLTTEASSAVPFKVSQAADSKFYFKKSDENKWLQHSNGGGGIRLWGDAANAENSRISLTYATNSAMGNDPYSLDGKTYGIAYHDESVTSAALTADGKTVKVNNANQNRLAALDMLMRPDVLDHDGLLLVAEGSDIQEWTFHSIERDKYYITTEVAGEQKYLTIQNGEVALKDEPDGTYSVVKATPGVGSNSGKWHFTANGYSLNLPNKANDGFNSAASSADTTWLNLVEKSVLTDDDFKLYTAKKVSVSDSDQVYSGQHVVLYTRIWNDTTKRYEFYAVDHDGKLIRCYDTGDNIEWIGTLVNTALWDFTEGRNSDGSLNYYYWLQNTQYGNYLVPQAASGKVTFDGAEAKDNNGSVNLNGRRYGESYTTVIAWDDAQYAYSGLKTQNGRVVPCPLSEAEDFYFAVVNPLDDEDELTTVSTIDNGDYGITMKMIDFNNPLIGSGDSARDSVQHPFFGAHGNGREQGLLSTNLTGDYPTTTSKTGHEESLGNLFSDMTTVNHLFLESIHKESGYFEYSSTQNFAHLNEDGTFTVYDQIAQVGANAYNNQGDFGETRAHGQFMPYNDLVAGRYSTATNHTDVLARELPDTDPRKGEKLYLIPKNEADYYFGMEVSASFTQTPSGLDAWGHDIIFEFSGDDDFWLYVDGELVLDLGGVRPALAGSVNFRTGVVNSAGATTSLYEVFKKNYQARGLSDSEINAKLDEIFTKNENGQYVFMDYSKHDMRIFYMERGAGGSNLHMRFNLAAVKPGTFLLSKKLSGTELQDSSLIEFPYQIYYYLKDDGETTGHLLGAKEGEADLVHYEGSTRTLKSAGEYASEFTPAQGTTTYKHVFFLKPGETAEVTLPDGAVSYSVVECGVNPDIYDEVRANNTVLKGALTPNKINGAARWDYETSRDTLANRSSVEYDNHVSENAMRTLNITKKLYDVNGTTELTYPDTESTFTFRLNLGDENAKANALPPANLYPYYIKDAEGHYCQWDADAKKFVSLGDTIKTYEALQQYFAENNWTDAQKEAVVFKTSMNGSISKIPAGYTVEVRNLVISTQYKVEERDNEIPKGYTRREGDGYARVDAGHEVEQLAPYTGTIANGEDPKLQVRNQKGWGLTAEKNWTDKDFMQKHDDIYFAVYVGNDFAKVPDHTDEAYDETKKETVYTTVYKDCVRALKSPASDLYFFFGDLYNGTKGTKRETTYNFAQFLVREVQLTGDATVQLDEEGYVTNLDEFTVTPIDDNGTLTVGGTPAGGAHRDDYAYTVSYQVGESTGQNENIRTDTITNSRPGIKLYKADWTGEWVTGNGGKTTLSGALPGAKFTLKDSAGNDVAEASYTSGDDGLITIAYLNAGTYTLTETETPGGYVCLDGPITITVAQDGTVSVSGVDDGYYSLDTKADSSMSAVITIKNRAVQLRATKVDEKTKEPLANVHFSLYRQVTDSSSNARKDYLPLSGYEDIVTDEDGILPDITMGLDPRTYYLTETQTQSGYALLSEDVCFTIGKDGTVTVNNGADTGSTVTRTDDVKNGTVAYTLTIPNYKFGVRLKKVDDLFNALNGAKFNLCINNDASKWESVDDDIDMTSSSMTTLSDLADGFYKLTETSAPAGYVILENAVYFSVENGAVQLTEEDGITPAGSNMALLGTETDQNKNTVYVITVINTPGTALPNTGGPGSQAFLILGGIMVTLAGAYLLFRRRVPLP